MHDWDVAWWEAAVRLLMAGCGAALLGWDREKKNRPAGLRTYIMVALGAAGFTLIACELFAVIRDAGEMPSGDPVRVIAAIVGGIGFLGAGAIIQSGKEVRGLTTAAGLWVAASIGMAAGLGFYMIAGLISGLGFVTLAALRDVGKQVDSTDDG